MRWERLAPPTSLVVCLLGCGPGDDDSDALDTGTSHAQTSTPTSTDASSSADGTSSGAATSEADTSSASGTQGESGSESTGDPVDPPSCGALAGLPSAPGPHVAMIDALPDDAWLDLGPPTPDPQFGEARGRSWGGRAFAFAPDLGGAFFTGEGVHAYVKPDGFGMDDVFFYDINAHAWIAIHPGVDTASFNQQVADGELTIDENGQLVDGNGEPVPLHLLIHAWDYVTYDPHARRFAMLAGDGMGRYFMPGEEQIDEGLTILEGMRAGIEIPNMSPWFYSPVECRWERYPVAGDAGASALGSGFPAFVYASASQRYLVAGMAGVWSFDPGQAAWSEVATTGPRPTGYDHGVAYDHVRNRLYLGGGSGDASPGVFVYDIATATWTYPASSGTAPTGVGTNSASLIYDEIADVVTVFHYGDGTHYTYAPDEEAWSDRPLPADVLTAVSYPSFNAFFDAERAAYFVYAATDSEDNGNMWAYRHQASAPR